MWRRKVKALHPGRIVRRTMNTTWRSWLISSSRCKSVGIVHLMAQWKSFHIMFFGGDNEISLVLSHYRCTQWTRSLHWLNHKWAYLWNSHWLRVFLMHIWWRIVIIRMNTHGNIFFIFYFVNFKETQNGISIALLTVEKYNIQYPARCLKLLFLNNLNILNKIWYI